MIGINSYQLVHSKVWLKGKILFAALMASLSDNSSVIDDFFQLVSFGSMYIRHGLPNFYQLTVFKVLYLDLYIGLRCIMLNKIV